MGMFHVATRKKLKLRMAIDGPSGSGKSYTGLRFAFALAGPGGRVAAIDTEHRSLSKYQGESPDGIPWDFQVCELDSYAPTTYMAAIHEAAAAGFDVLLIDSLSHAWEGTGGALDQVSKRSSDGGNSFTAWKDVTPMHRGMIDAILAAPMHIIATMRVKTEYVLEEEERKGGRKVVVPKKVGLAPIQRAGMEYEFDVYCDMDLTQTLTVAKTRCSAVRGQIVVEPTPAFLEPVKRWLDVGERAEVADVHGVSITAPLVMPAPTETSSCRNTDRCSETQRARILALAESIDMPVEALKASVVRRGAQCVADLSIVAANDLIAALERKHSELEADSLFGQAGGVGNAGGTPGVAGTPSTAG